MRNLRHARPSVSEREAKAMVEHYPLIVAVGAASGLIAAGISGWWAAYRADATRRHQQFAEALATVTEYCEFPYVIRRRGSGDPEAERLRISSELRHVQQRIAFHQAWLQVESGEIADAYQALVSEMRRVVGSQMHDAWERHPIEVDAEMNISGFEREEFDDLRAAYLDAVRRRCSWQARLANAVRRWRQDSARLLRWTTSAPRS